MTLRDGKFELTRKSGEPSFYNVVMKLTIFNISREDFGTYRCIAKNPQGETSGEISLYGLCFWLPCAIEKGNLTACIWRHIHFDIRRETIALNNDVLFQWWWCDLARTRSVAFWNLWLRFYFLYTLLYVLTEIQLSSNQTNFVLLDNEISKEGDHEKIHQTKKRKKDSRRHRNRKHKKSHKARAESERISSSAIRKFYIYVDRVKLKHILYWAISNSNVKTVSDGLNSQVFFMCGVFFILSTSQ